MNRLCKLLLLACLPYALTAMAEETSQSTASMAEPPHRLVWSLGMRLKMEDAANPGDLSPRPMIGLRYGRWRVGPVDGITWHRFGQIQTDNSLTYDWLDSPRWRTALSASIVNLQKDSPTDAIEPGRKTVRGKATLDYLGWSHWSVGLVLTQDLLGRGAGTSLGPSVTYRQALTDSSTILLSQSFTWAKSDLWRYSSQLDPSVNLGQPSHWGTSMSTSLTLRQRWKAHWSWFAQISRSQTLQSGDPLAREGQSNWAGQIGLVYFQR